MNYSCSTQALWKSIDNIFEVALREEFWNKQEVHIWQVPIIYKQELYTILSQEEKEKAEKFRFASDKKRYIVSHGILRILLAEYISSDTSIINIKRTKYGKPYIEMNGSECALSFNMSHSNNLVCFILSNSIEVGIDIEYIKRDFEWLSVARRIYSPEKIAQINALPENFQAEAFFSEWTRIESFLKVIGKGLAGLDEIIVSPYLEKYSITSFCCGENYQGALAVNRETPELRFFKYEY